MINDVEAVIMKKKQRIKNLRLNPENKPLSEHNIEYISDINYQLVNHLKHLIATDQYIISDDIIAARMLNRHY